jgi:HAD superfamily hydrolase (TIGR01549 family)
MEISTIFFDLGSTLVYSKDPWPPIYIQADRAMVAVLQSAGISVDSSSFITEYGGFIQSYYHKQFKDNIEPTTFATVRDLLTQKGYSSVPDTILLNAIEAMYSFTQKNWYREGDAITTLETLKNLGYRMGIISNTSDDKNVHGIVDRLELRPYFEYIITSAALGIRKPDKRIFQAALDYFQVSPNAVAMVGDLLQTDVLGANDMGIYSIWITRRSQNIGDGELAIQPKAVVTELSQIPALLNDIRNDLIVESP